MVRVGEVSETKSQLVTNICSISERPITCAHLRRRPPRNPIASPFIDWYLLLQVEENVGTDMIRKQYLKLALLLHPDKNKHPKAEMAFKLVYEAYACLSDNTQRAAFDLERQNSFCNACKKIPHLTNPSSKTSTKLRGLFSPRRSKSDKVSRGMNDLKARFMDEAEVIEKCFKVNASSRKDHEAPTCNTLRKETPVFNPLDYLSQGYPHYRIRNYQKPDNSFWCFRTENTCKQQKGNCDSPIFDFRSERRPVKVRSVRVGSS